MGDPLWIKRHAGPDDAAQLDVMDQNGLRAATIIVRTGDGEVSIEVQRIENDPTVRIVVP